MVERLVVLVDNDPVLSERVRAVLTAHNFKVDVIADGNELLTNQQLHPVLIILCIDPKRLGWAICNRVKKTMQYRDVPLFVTSQEATDKDFEEHKKLRTRAEEYLHKPYSVDVLLDKIDRLIGLRPHGDSDEGAVSLDDAAIEEISVDEAVIEEEVSAVEILDTTLQKHLDDDLDEETDAAFEAIGVVSKASPALGSSPKSTATATPSAQSRPPAGQAKAGAQPLPPSGEPTVMMPRRGELDRLATPRPESPAAGLAGERTQILTNPAPRSSATDLHATLRQPSSSRASEQEMHAAAALDGGREVALLANVSTLEQALAEAKQRAEKAEQQAAFWHDQRDQLASERDQIAAECNQLAIERNQLAAERDGLKNAELQHQGPSPELLAAQAQLSVAREEHTAERNQLYTERNQLAAERNQLYTERNQLAAERQELHERLARLSAERDELLLGHDRLAADFSQLQVRLSQAEQSAQEAAKPSPEIVAELGKLAELQKERDELRSELERLREAVSTWQSERPRLLAELEELKSRPAPAPTQAQVPPTGMLRDREIISLKEVINKKDKEILDLRDTLDNKDRQILDARDKAREMERQKRELDERLLSFEREQLGLQEKFEAVAQDKEVWQEREKGLKGRLEDAQRRLARSEEEQLELRRRLELEMARIESALAEERQRSQTAILNAAEAQALAQKQALEEERAAAAETRRALEQRQAQEWAQLEAQYQARFDERMRRHEETLASVQRAHEAQIQELVAQHQQSLSAVTMQRDQAVSDLGEANAQHEAMLERKMNEAEARLRAAASAEKDALRNERNAFERRASELEAELTEWQHRLLGAEENLAKLNLRYADSEALLHKLQADLSEREQQVHLLQREKAAMQDQIQRAYQRLLSDENQISRVRRALSIALDILEKEQPAAETSSAGASDGANGSPHEA